MALLKNTLLHYSASNLKVKQLFTPREKPERKSTKKYFKATPSRFEV